MKTKYIFFCGIMLFSAVILISCTGGYNIAICENIFNSEEIKCSPSEHSKELLGSEPIEQSTIVINFIGDCMLASELYAAKWNSFNLFAQDKPPEYFFEKVSNVFKADDFTVANCENVFTDNSPAPCEKNYTPSYWYKSNSANAEIFSVGGIDIVSIANNHSLDFGVEGKRDTSDALEKYGVEWGDTDRPLLLEKNGIKIALYCTTISNGGYIGPITKWYEKIKDETDFQIVFYHGGIEMSHQASPSLVNSSHMLIDLGIDIVIGHHPHVLQPMENYNGGTIIYSLGNFLFGGGKPENRTAIYQLTLHTNDGKIIGRDEKIIPAYCYGDDWQPCVITDEEEASDVTEFMRGKRELPY